MGIFNIWNTNNTNKAGLTYTGTSDKTIDVNSLVSSTNIKTVNGSSLLGSGDMPIYTGFKNYIINGNFDVWQYGTSQTSSGYGSDDRWLNANTVSTKTHSQIACTDTERALFNSAYFSRTVVSSVAGVGNYVAKVQRIEDITKLAGKTVTLSFWAKAESNKNICIEFEQNFGTGGTPTSYIVGISSQLVALTTTWQKKTITVTIPSIVGKTLGTDGVNTSFLGINFWFDAGSSFNSRTANIGQQSGTFDIAQVQLEEGSVATPFEQRHYGLELSLCQRYYWRWTTGDAYTYFGYAYARTGGFRAIINHPQPMRTKPTVMDISSISGFQFSDDFSGFNITSIIPDIQGIYTTSLTIVASGTSTNGYSAALLNRAGYTSYIGFGAEL